jgi:peptide/nickel transport system permease protein
MLTFVLRRFLASILVLFAVASATFFALHLSGDPVTASLQANGATPEEIHQVREQLGYNRPLLLQYVHYVADLLHGDLGVSFRYGTKTLPIVMERLPFTLYLAAVALVITLIVSLPLGMLAAARHGKLTDRVICAFAALGQSVPTFVTGPALILLFAVTVRWFPVSGAAKPSAVVLPAVTLSIFAIARVARLLRSSMLEVADADYVRSARAKGLSERRVLSRYIVRNALLPVITLISIQVASLLGGAVVVEAIFGWPGIGNLAHSALQADDFTLAQTIVLVIAVGVVVINFVTDLIYAFIDPRIRYE